MLFAAKSYWPGITADEFRRAASTDQGLTLGGDDARAAYRGTLVFTDDELVLCLFESSSAVNVRQATARLHLPCERIMPLDWLPASAGADGRRWPHRPARRRPDA
jgi:hypothetical protein